VFVLRSQKAHGTCEHPVMNDLRFGCDKSMADRVCCFNRHYAEHAGYWKETNFLKEVMWQMTSNNSVTDKIHAHTSL
jgi:hypothetical protein